MKITVLSDTHGLLRPEVLPFLSGADAILHAGDVVDDRILTTLRQYAPTFAVRGNCDAGPGLAALPEVLRLSLGGVDVMMLHHLADLPPEGAKAQVVISGHTHKPLIERRGALYLNPGSCGPRRFSLPVTLALLHLAPDGSAQAELRTLL